MLDWVWPNIQTQYDARRAAARGAGASFIVAFCTALITYLHINGTLKLLPQLNASAFIDAILFLMIGIGISKMSRIAAFTGFVLYAAEQYYMFKTGNKPILVAAIFILLFMGALRGTLAYHRLNKEVKQDPYSAGEWLKKNLLILVLLALLAGAIVFLCQLGFRSGAPPRIKIPWKPYFDLNIFWKSGEDQEIGRRTFRLESGQTVRGRVIFEDKDYYTVEVFGGRHEIVVKEDIKKEEKAD